MIPSSSFDQAFYKLKKTFSQFAPISEMDWELVKPHINLLQIKKGDYFIKEGQICNHVGFLSEGILRVYYTTEEKDITSYFNSSGRNPVVSAFYSFLSGKPSPESIHALEDSALIVIKADSLNRIYDESPIFQKLGRLMAEQNYLSSINRIYSFQHKPAQERYEELIRKYKGVLHKIPQHYIASYLGITPESLSRIRAAIAKK